MTRKMTKMERQMDAVESARAEQALELEAMHDYIDVGDVRLYRPTVAHGWVITRLTQVARSRKWAPFDLQLVVGYVLAHDADTVRNTLSRAVRTNEAKLPEMAEDYFFGKAANPTEVLPAIGELMQDLAPKKATAPTPAGSSPAGGAV